MTIEQAAEILDLTTASVRRLVRQGKIMSVKRRELRYTYSMKGTRYRRWAWVWDLDGKAVRGLKKRRNRG